MMMTEQHRRRRRRQKEITGKWWLNKEGDGEGLKPTETETTTVMDRDRDKVLEGHGQPDKHSRKDEEPDQVRQMARRNGWSIENDIGD